MERTLLFVLLLISAQVFGQESTECFTIDFEQIPNNIPVEGMSIDSQFYEAYGVTFILDNGESPKLAEVGAPATAFVTAGEDDSPKPGQNTGSFFLTDDGIVNKLDDFSLNMKFETPVDRVAGYVLDIDTDEIFTIQAFDELGMLIYQDTIVFGDPETGDALVTYWEFAVTPCEGEIYSVKLKGEKEMEGLFGLGIDNLEFCRIDYAVEDDKIAVEVKDAVCGENNGSLTVMIKGEADQYRYAIDQEDFQTENTFDQLAAGNYSITIQNLNNCATTTRTVTVEAITPPSIENILTTSTTCAETNGSLRIEASGGSGTYQYSLDGETFQSTAEFQNLEAKAYTIYVKDEHQCLVSETVMLEDSPPIVIEEVMTSPTGCKENIGSIEVRLSGGVGPLSLSLNGETVQTHASFTDLEEGDYQLIITDELGCQIDTLIHISAIECQVFLPNAFTPNDDGLNDVFQAKTESEATVKEYVIYNRWGELLYTYADFPIHSTEYWWDGTYQGSKVDLGTYIYKITIEFADGTLIRRNGQILVVDS